MEDLFPYGINRVTSRNNPAYFFRFGNRTTRNVYREARQTTTNACNVWKGSDVLCVLTDRRYVPVMISLGGKLKQKEQRGLNIDDRIKRFVWIATSKNTFPISFLRDRNHINAWLAAQQPFFLYFPVNGLRSMEYPLDEKANGWNRGNAFTMR